MIVNKEFIEALENAPLWIIVLLVFLFLIGCITYYFAHRNNNDNQ